MRKIYKPVTPGQRHLKRRVDTEQGSRYIPKELRYGKKKTGGRNNRGRITAFHRGGGFKQLLRQVQ
jgi:large subunit ribosomal protein L2